MNDIDGLKNKYPKLIKEINIIDKAHKNLTDYFASIVNKGYFNAKDLFCQSVINRTNQCIFSSYYCLLNGYQFPLLNIMRQMIEIHAVNEYILSDMANFEKYLFGKHHHPDKKLKQLNVSTIVEKLKNSEPKIVQIYDNCSELSHPNSESVFSAFSRKKGEQKKSRFSMSSCNRKISSDDAYHIVRNIGGLANRIYLSIQKISPIDKWISIHNLDKQSKWKKILKKTKRKTANWFKSRINADRFINSVKIVVGIGLAVSMGNIYQKALSTTHPSFWAAIVTIILIFILLIFGGKLLDIL